LQSAKTLAVNVNASIHDGREAHDAPEASGQGAFAILVVFELFAKALPS
jgi:hypothetical protein